MKHPIFAVVALLALAACENTQEPLGVSAGAEAATFARSAPTNPDADGDGFVCVEEKPGKPNVLDDGNGRPGSCPTGFRLVNIAG